jgi:uncharacterized membrane protein YagU involved in acid resistance
MTDYPSAEETMATVTLPTETQRQGTVPALIRTGLSVGLSDFFFASALSVLVPPYSTPLRVFQGVASVLFGRGMLSRGVGAGILGLFMHFCVAFFWSGLFVLALRYSVWLREALRSWPRALVVAAIYGMSIWVIMSWVVIPSFVHRPPAMNLKWWILLFGHIPFVAMPMILVNRFSGETRSR